MYTDPQIFNPEDTTKRGFIFFNFNGKRYRFYTGKPIGVDCFPNSSKTHKERERLFKHLLREFTKSLVKGWSPESPVAPELKSEPIIEKPSFEEVLGKLVEHINKSSYSKTYKRDLVKISEQFLKFLGEEGKQLALADDIVTSDVERFLQQFSSSGTYYQNKRRNLTVVFSKLVKLGYCKSNPVEDTSKRKAKAVLHQAYTPEQLEVLLPYLRDNYPNLFICALLMYGTLLRPHQEIRLLKRRHFNNDFTRFLLDGNENKSGRIRSLAVPGYVRNALIYSGKDKLKPEHNIFTGADWAYNDCYFSTKWGRIRKKLIESGMLKQNQTLYSFRHSASINVFDKTQDLKLLQQLFDHSSLNTTLIYLRSIGVVQISSSSMPDLKIA
ncbi:site-specific integrase [Rufibacter tibetensis]|uniref:Tyr recombinase domain-containing protein n=1 Tax=Rufibacter tibetensis TaxID=512763 RepID=A0A0P0CWH1_9BACT|nr:site-specific integrase [Rufibacter tibetensis]ALI98934.1 hypothetical protein DC20_08025 [Rufibacter tibetensis]